MEIQEAVAEIVKSIRKTQKSIPETIKLLWRSRLSQLSDEARRELIQDALSERAGNALCGGTRYSDRIDTALLNTKEYAVGVLRSEPKMKNYAIEILRNTAFDINGVRKALIFFTSADFNYYIGEQTTQMVGIERRVAAAKVGEEMLRKYKVRTVEKLPEETLKEFANTWRQATRTLKEEAA